MKLPSYVCVGKAISCDVGMYVGVYKKDFPISLQGLHLCGPSLASYATEIVRFSDSDNSVVLEWICSEIPNFMSLATTD